MTEVASASRFEKGYDFLEKKVCSYSEFFNKFFKAISFGALTFSHLRSLGRVGEIAALVGRVRPAFYLPFLLRDAPKLIKERGGVRENFSLSQPERRNILKGIATLLGLTFASGFITKGVLDIIAQAAKLKQLAKPMKELGRWLNVITVGSGLVGLGLTYRAYKAGQTGDAALKGSEQTVNVTGTVLALELLPDFEGALFASEALRAMAGAFGTWSACRQLSTVPPTPSQPNTPKQAA